MNYRIEHDSMGDVEVPADKLWGAQTQRSLQHFAIGDDVMPREIILAFAYLKWAAATANAALGVLSEQKAQAIAAVCNEILQGKLDDQFPLSVWQTGSGTHTNMNVNEVITGRAASLDPAVRLHPNDDVNRSQSSNDTFPTAMHVATVLALEQTLLPALQGLRDTMRMLSIRYADVVKCGRTHLQDAVPITFGQEVSAWQAMLDVGAQQISAAMQGLRQLALGGTAVGTGLNAPQGFDEMVAARLSELCGTPFASAPNKFYALSAKDEFIYLHGALKALAANLLKIANDVRWLASGPRCGLGEITIPQNEPGSSIMPGKVNPTQCEALSMVAVQVMGNDVAVGIAASQGNFQLNVYLPLIAHNVLRSIRLLGDAMRSFDVHCAQGIRPDVTRMQHNLDNTLMTVTALTPYIGYTRAAEIAHKAYAEDCSLRQACLQLGYMTAEQFDAVYHPSDMATPHDPH